MSVNEKCIGTGKRRSKLSKELISFDNNYSNQLQKVRKAFLSLYTAASIHDRKAN